MDGVVVDSELQWQLAEGALLRRHAPRWREQDHHLIVGLGVEDLYHFLVRKYSLTSDKAAFLKDCHQLAELIYKRRVRLAPGFRELSAQLRRLRLPAALASSSPRGWVELVLRRFGLRSCFRAIACADDVPAGRTKPAPDLYRLALRRLGLSNGRDCLAVEDSTLGARAAKAAGLACAGLRNGSNDSQDLSACDFEIRSLRELTAPKETAAASAPAGRRRRRASPQAGLERRGRRGA